MKNACLAATGLGRHRARASLAALAFVGIAGCGGSVSGGDCSWFSNNIDHCFSTVGTGTFAVAFVSPQEAADIGLRPVAEARSPNRSFKNLVVHAGNKGPSSDRMSRKRTSTPDPKASYGLV